MLDEADRALVQALQINGRVSYTLLGAVIGVSTQTVARRYQRLRAEAGLRVTGLVDMHRGGSVEWMVRITASPRTAQDLATALARRADTSWVKLTSGGTEIFAVVRVPTGDDHSLLLRDIPRTAGITAVSAHLMVHSYLGGPTSWRGLGGTLDESQQRALVEPRDGAGAEPGEGDAALLAALRRDGRATFAVLAAATGTTPATVGRRIAELRASGALFFDIEIDAALLGVRTQALLWMSVVPSRLDAVGTTLAGHDEMAVVMATTGPTNLLAQAMCADPAALHRYLTHRLGALEDIRAVETAPVLRRVKATSPLAF